MGILGGIWGKLKAVGSALREKLGAKPVPFTLLPFEREVIEPHAPREKFHKIADKFITEYGMTAANAKEHAAKSLAMERADLSPRDRVIIAEFSP